MGRSFCIGGMMMKQLESYILDQLQAILAIPSPSGYTKEAAQYACREFEKLGVPVTTTVKGGVLADLGGSDSQDGVLLMAHLDTLGGVVGSIKANGRLRISPLGGLMPDNTCAENCTVITRFDGSYTGTLQIDNASAHVNTDYKDQKRDFDHMEVVLDQDTTTQEETRQLGIRPGDVVAFDPRTVITPNGYIKSRFLDDKLSVAILLGYAKYLKEQSITPQRRLYIHLTVYEEVGHGGRSSVPQGVTELLCVDMGCVGEGLDCTEKQVSICAKDSAGPATYDMVTDLIRAAEEAGLDYAVDVYPRYGSDADAALGAGYDVRHGLIGPGVYASHGYERSHVDGAMATLRLLQGYLG